MPAHGVTTLSICLCIKVRGRPLHLPCHLHMTSKCYKPTERGHGRCTLSSSLCSATLTRMTSKGSWASLPPSPFSSSSQVFPPSRCRPLLRICVSVLDTLMHSHQHTRVHRPSVLGKLAFKLRYFREVNHPGASQHCLLRFLSGRQAQGPGPGAVEFAGRGPLSLALPRPPNTQPLKGWRQTLSASADISPGVHRVPSVIAN